MKIRLILKDILPFYIRLVVLAAATLFIDLILHLTDLVSIGRYLWIAGIILILLSFGHSLGKHGNIKNDNGLPLGIKQIELRLYAEPKLLVHAVKRLDSGGLVPRRPFDQWRDTHVPKSGDDLLLDLQTHGTNPRVGCSNVAIYFGDLP